MIMTCLMCDYATFASRPTDIKLALVRVHYSLLILCWDVLCLLLEVVKLFAGYEDGPPRAEPLTFTVPPAEHTKSLQQKDPSISFSHRFYPQFFAKCLQQLTQCLSVLFTPKQRKRV